MIEQSVLDGIAVTRQEYDEIVRRLGREPNMVELGMFGAMWSEHCGYKNSKPLLKRFPTEAPWVLQGPGENAGVVDIGNGQAAVFKVESHNHPSSVEPFEGAATGVGGIIRDIFTMGARPIASLNSLRFGPLSEPRNRYLFSGAVGGIASYGNCIGVPTVGGEVAFGESYNGNPLVNAMALGLVRADAIMRSRASGVGNTIMLVGADTGRDGIHGCSGLASREFCDETADQRPTVQVGNPFLEKCLIEACLELMQYDFVVGMQDLGAAGMTSSVVEAAAKGQAGVEIDISKVPQREENMTAYEVMLSESQERMLITLRKGSEAEAKKVFDKWDLHSDVVGFVTDDGIVRVRNGSTIEAEIPYELLTEPPTYIREGVEAPGIAELRARSFDALPEPDDLGAVLLRLLASPNIASKEIVYRQCDYLNHINTVQAPGEGDAAVLRIKGTNTAIALAIDGNSRYCYLNPKVGGAIAVAEATRNVACSGARPLAISDCLNFGNPEKAHIYYQLSEAIDGMAEACRVLNTPVIGGNVSLFNETSGEAIYPTPIVGALGLMPHAGKSVSAAFKTAGDRIALIGPFGEHLGASEYLSVVHGRVEGDAPPLDLQMEAAVQDLVIRAGQAGLLSSAHDCADGGLAVALAESCILGGTGACCTLSAWQRADAALFGESQSRIVVSLPESNLAALEELAKENDVPLAVIGSVGGASFSVQGVFTIPVDKIADAWRGGLARNLAGAAE